MTTFHETLPGGATEKLGRARIQCPVLGLGQGSSLAHPGHERGPVKNVGVSKGCVLD